jgi:uncharacterized protein with PIN domain
VCLYSYEPRLSRADLPLARARDTGEPLLFKGNDFARTDVIAAAY